MNVSTIDFADFVKSINLERFLDQRMTPNTLRWIDCEISTRFRVSECCGEILMPFDGMQIIGGQADFGKNSTNIRWKSQFFPGSRFTGQHGDCQPLGFFEEFDLYVGIQPPLSPTLIARYGHQPGDYLTYNPALMGIENISDAGEHFAEALRRALFVNFDLKL